MSETPPPAFQFYPRDWRASSTVRLMSYEERGVYWELLGIAWDDGSIPADEAVRARLLGLTVAKLRKLWPAMESKWVSDGNGGLVNPRQEKQRAELEAYREAKRVAGRASGRSRRRTAREREANEQ